jgi:multisubunit Na+/H+ antiporter MnhB subunit
MSDLGSPVLRTIARYAVPVTALVSVRIFFQGHNLPGGGFIAGAMAAVAGAIYLLAFGTERAVRFPWWKLSVVGLLVALATGTVPWIAGDGFMNHTILDLSLPLVGHLHLPTSTFFDIGVYMIVLGTLMTIFVELAGEGN